MHLFHSPSPADLAWALTPLRAAGRRGCEYSLSCSTMWQHVYQLTIGCIDGFYVVRSEHFDTPAYLFPAGDGDLSAALYSLEAIARSEGVPLRFYSLTAEDRTALETLWPNRFSYAPNPDAFEYLYSSESLRTLSGKKLHAKRNFVNRFVESYPDWSFEAITPENISECRGMTAQWLASQEEGTDPDTSLFSESQAVSIMLDHFFELGLVGGLLRTGGRVVAYAAGERLGGGMGDTFDVRVEKAFYDVPGAYAMINQCFARTFCQDVAYINREDDAGDEGLRRAKQSYRPVQMLEKFTAISEESL